MNSSSTKIRPATGADVGRIFAWRNDPWIVSLSAGQRTVTWDEHSRWYNDTLASANRLLYLVESDDESVGTLRVDRTGPEEAEIAIYLDRSHVGRGIGVAAIRQGVRAAMAQWPPLIRVIARVRSGNAPSISAFAKAGFAPCDDTDELRCFAISRADLRPHPGSEDQ